MDVHQPLPLEPPRSVALGFQTDKTRIATLLLCRDISGLFYPFLDVRKAYHPASHHELSDAWEQLTRYYIGQFAYLAARLEAMPEGPGTVLAALLHLLIIYRRKSHKTDNARPPLILAGKLGGTLETGRVLDCAGRGDENRRLWSLYLGIMNRMGVTLDRFGDADRRLDGI
jgi:hypothetical protein